MEINGVTLNIGDKGIYHAPDGVEYEAEVVELRTLNPSAMHVPANTGVEVHPERMAVIRITDTRYGTMYGAMIANPLIATDANGKAGVFVPEAPAEQPEEPEEPEEPEDPDEPPEEPEDPGEQQPEG